MADKEEGYDYIVDKKLNEKKKDSIRKTHNLFLLSSYIFMLLVIFGMFDILSFSKELIIVLSITAYSCLHFTIPLRNNFKDN